MNMNYAEIFKRVRKKKKMNQMMCSYELGITQTYLSGIESGKFIPSRKILIKLSELIEIPIEALLWFNIDVDSIPYKKQDPFKILKPGVDSLIMTLIDEDFFD